MSGTEDAAATFRARAQQARDAGDFYEAAVQQRRAITLYRAADDKVRLAHALRHMADILLDSGSPSAAGHPLTEALELYADLPDAPPLDVADAMRSEAMRLWALGDDEAALVYWRAVRDRYAALDELFRVMRGEPGNPGTEEADSWIARLVRLSNE